MNDNQWGKGFTEWRQLARGLPRFAGHIQPRIPRDLGFYDLSEGDAFRRQIDMAKAAGLEGFCFYHYAFAGKRVLETPMERFLADPTLDFQFCLMWANENWTRTWDGAENEVILRQTYDRSIDDAMIEDLARHMKDPRYMRIDGRPIFFIYRPGHIPDAKVRITEWRKLFSENHGLQPLFFMAQGFHDTDPRVFGMDGAIEFPPHKLAQNLPQNIPDLVVLDPNFAGEKTNSYPLIRTVVPGWDNEARRPGRGTILYGSTPAKFGAWAGDMIRYAAENPVHGETIICVNAWNEWAESAVLEPDVHFGAAYLNELSRTIHGIPSNAATDKTRILLVGHDAFPHGAQYILLNLARTLRSCFGADIRFLLGAGGSLIDSYRAIGPVQVASTTAAGVERFCKGLASDGWTLAITNTTPAGKFIPDLKNAGFRVVSLVHELPNLLGNYRLQEEAKVIATRADLVIFPADIVRKGFRNYAGRITQPTEISPQGLYRRDCLDATPGDHGLRAELGLSPQTRIIVGVGYADLRKGIDRFVSTGLSLAAAHDDIAFLWIGAPAPEASSWFLPEIAAAGLADRVRILGHREDVARFLAAADAYYLSSREDPFPSVVLEALGVGLPVVGHKGCGGCDDLIEKHGTLVARHDPIAAAAALLKAVRKPNPRAARARRDEVVQNYDFTDYAFSLVQRLKPGTASVSAIVPNYNYAAYIGGRLRSVFDQTHPLREVIVLDDASPDTSLEEIARTTKAADRTIDLVVNPTNSGSPFAQWRKGVERAKGDYVWIAEADDLADPSFVARLVDRMQLAGSVLGFTDSRQMDETGTPLGASYRPYMNEIEPGLFDRPFDMDGREFLSRFLAVKNVILNVSGVIAHRQTLLDAFASVGDELYGFKVAGDWRLYAEICVREGSTVSWLPEPLNSHRRHKLSVTQALDVDRHLAEIERMQEWVGERIALGPNVKSLQMDHLKASHRYLTAGQ
ncbi:MAG: hypothetical protein B7Z10_00890 [Rhodobacterales bacterium 32-66-7]|nr:MAG: hypothetical protein B7Z10_00890 [Rhodobacterales bacterium 32-66-7]